MKPESGVFKTVLLVALPASGKSEVRNFMDVVYTKLNLNAK